MPKYIVTVSYTQSKDIWVWAKDPDAAQDKACEIVENWNGVTSADAMDCMEE